jgi:TetR/AcrR family transcriptional regulator, transcriptional repressor for nem operon
MNTSNCSKNTGCLMVNAMVELAPHDPEIRVLAQAHARAVEGKLATRLSVAQLNGEISRDKDPVALARYLYHIMLGLGVASRAFGDREAIRTTAALALSVLN